jgi:hypothetical protein
MNKRSLFGIGCVSLLASLGLSACGSAELPAEQLAESAGSSPDRAPTAEPASVSDGAEPATSAYCADTTSPVVAVTAPSGGTLVGGTTVTIRWRAADLCNDGAPGTIKTEKIRFSCAGTAPFDLIAEVPGTARDYSWKVPCRECIGARILVRAWDKADNPSADAISGSFNITPGASCTRIPPIDPDPCRRTPPDPICL